MTPPQFIKIKILDLDQIIRKVIQINNQTTFMDLRSNILDFKIKVITTEDYFALEESMKCEYFIENNKYFHAVTEEFYEQYSCAYEYGIAKIKRDFSDEQKVFNDKKIVKMCENTKKIKMNNLKGDDHYNAKHDCSVAKKEGIGKIQGSAIKADFKDIKANISAENNKLCTNLIENKNEKTKDYATRNNKISHTGERVSEEDDKSATHINREKFIKSIHKKLKAKSSKNKNNITEEPAVNIEELTVPISFPQFSLDEKNIKRDEPEYSKPKKSIKKDEEEDMFK